MKLSVSKTKKLKLFNISKLNSFVFLFQPKSDRKYMKKIMVSALFILFSTLTFSQELISPFIKLGTKKANISSVTEEVKNNLKSANFSIIGEYSPLRDDSIYIIAFTSEELYPLTDSLEGMNILASVFKIGLTFNNKKTEILVTNPSYLAHAFLGQHITEQHKQLFKSIENKILTSFNCSSPIYCGGEMEVLKLATYSYKPNMPSISTPKLLKEFTSYSTAVQVIKSNLDARKGKNMKIFELINTNKQIAVFGVGITNDLKGENRYLSTLGKDKAASLPYEIVVIANKAFMIDRAYRFALFYPSIPQTSFSQIMSISRGIDEMLELICKEN